MSVKNPFGKNYARKNQKTIAPPPPPPPPTQTIEYAPGHWWLPLYNNLGGVVSRAAVFNELAAYNFRGIKLRYSWMDFESTMNVYNFTQLDADLAQCAATGKKLMMLISIGGLTDYCVPAYCRTAAYEMGQWRFTSNQWTNTYGVRPTWWNSNLQIRVVALLKALATHLKASPYYSTFHGVGYTETIAEGATDIVITTAMQDGWYYCNKLVLTTLREQLPTKIVYQYLNSPRSRLNEIVEHLKLKKGAIGTPDTYIDGISGNMKGNRTSPTYQGIYEYFNQESHNVPIFGSIQPTNYQMNMAPSDQNLPNHPPVYEPTIQQLVDFNQNYLKTNYLIWTRFNGTSPSRGTVYYQEALSFLQQPAQSSTPSGGLDSYYPDLLKS